MGFDDPVVLVLVLGVVVFLFGSAKIPQLARSLGQARKEFDNGWKGVTTELTRPLSAPTTNAQVSTVVPKETTVQSPSVDPLIVAAQNEGIETQGKSKQQIASELSWKLNKK